jgi:hypothetical protein
MMKTSLRFTLLLLPAITCLFFGNAAAESVDGWSMKQAYEHTEQNGDEGGLRLAASSRTTVRCESQRGRYNYCRTGTWGRVRLDRQLSDAPCRRYYTWGEDGDGSGIWVSDGCRAIFVIEGYGPPDRGGRTITCQSQGFEYNHCRVKGRKRVSLERQLSKTRCQRGDNWGVDDRGIWVDRGCGAVFRID